MKGLMIAPQPFFSPRGTPFSIYYRALISSESGVEIDLLTYGEGMDVDLPNVRIIRIPRFKFLGNVKIGPSYLKLFLDLFIFFWATFLLLRKRYDFVHAHEEAIFFCIFLKPMFRFKLIYDMHSSLPQQLLNFKFTNSNLLINFFKKLEDASIQAADAVITICPDLADYVNGVIRDKQKHLLIENSIFEPVKLDNNTSNATDNNGTKMHTNCPIDIPDGVRAVVYAGTLESYQGIDVLIRSFKFVLEDVPDAYLLIVGGNSSQVDFYTKLANAEGVQDHVVFTGRVSQSLAKHYCQLASVQMSPRSAGTNTPLKVYEQLASGIPLVATDIYSHTQVLNRDVAFLVRPEPEDMSRGIVRVLQDDRLAEKISANARKLYQQKYSRPIYEQKMQQLLKLVA